MGTAAAATDAAGRWRELAWDGVSFPVPAAWELAGYEQRAGATRLTIEDSADVRMEAEWSRRGAAAGAARIARRHARHAARLAALAARSAPLAGAPAPWVAYRYDFADGRRLATALRLPGEWPVAILLRWHQPRPEESRLDEPALRALRQFDYRESGAIPWRAFDLRLRVPRRFRLAGTSLLAGRKLLVFECRLRRLMLWRFSLADRFLRGRPAAEALADWLNRHAGLRGARFSATADGRVAAARRRRRHPFGHAEEIGRWCFRYHVIHQALPADNALMAAVFHYRRETDRAWLRELVLDEP
jgi:hypothetical protein